MTKERGSKNEPDATVYRDLIQRVAADPRTRDSQALTRLVILLSSTQWSYGGVAAWTEQMSDASLALALRLIKRYLETGRCLQLQRASVELRSTLVSLH